MQTTEMLRSYQSLYKSLLGPLERVKAVTYDSHFVIIKTSLRTMAINSKGQVAYEIF